MSDRPAILFREQGLETKDEFRVALDTFPEVYTLRSKIPADALVIGRYSVLPFYEELEADLFYTNSDLINKYHQHRYVADIQNWYQDLQDLTFKTWFRLEDVPDDVGPVVLKGETNSMKNRWKTHMFANNKKEAVEVYLKLRENPLLDNQNIYIRQFVPLKSFMTDPISGQPITKEFRIFVLDGSVMAGGYYWASHVDQVPEEEANFSQVPMEFVHSVINRVKNNIRFFVLDVAEKQDGGWVVVELNDGQMSGLSCVDPKELYENMYNKLTLP